MLPAAARMRRREEFTATVSRGARAASPALVVHLRHLDVDDGIRVGFVVTRAVGNAVTRNRVRRRLRHLMRTRWADLPAGTTVVVRANPGAAVASAAELVGQLDRALSRARRNAADRATPAGAGA